MVIQQYLIKMYFKMYILFQIEIDSLIYTVDFFLFGNQIKLKQSSSQEFWVYMIYIFFLYVEQSGGIGSENADIGSVKKKKAFVIKYNFPSLVQKITNKSDCQQQQQ
eukprot:TRINITY_DN2936_c0_g1_i12.p3 TRINITY_DN2936_c0_g1~~TRINITY_DN2936_c0_g1_i12.p3  ORF type:complete len:107 (-),score=0.85 TRINITY_DN2936_c0_g1_i12:635-955(-)